MNLLTGNNVLFIEGQSALLENDTQMNNIVVCPFYRGNVYSPCTEIKWSLGANKVLVNGEKVLVKTSIGECKASGLLQGIAVIQQTQQKVTAL
ncbi:MAG: hypothetical protein HRO68_10255 [Nitrosopumilus sp.]|nr:hypothetical protein [Nitrosopumilus sp.]